MKAYRVLAYSARIAFWLGAVVLIGLTSSSLKKDWNDVIYVINAAFLLFGGLWLGDWIDKRVTAFFNKPKSPRKYD